MRQNLITLGFFVGILSLPVAVAACGEGLLRLGHASASSPVPELSQSLAIGDDAANPPLPGF